MTAPAAGASTSCTVTLNRFLQSAAHGTLHLDRALAAIPHPDTSTRSQS